MFIIFGLVKRWTFDVDLFVRRRCDDEMYETRQENTQSQQRYEGLYHRWYPCLHLTVDTLQWSHLSRNKQGALHGVKEILTGANESFSVRGRGKTFSVDANIQICQHFKNT